MIVHRSDVIAVHALGRKIKLTPKQVAAAVVLHMDYYSTQKLKLLLRVLKLHMDSLRGRKSRVVVTMLVLFPDVPTC